MPSAGRRPSRLLSRSRWSKYPLQVVGRACRAAQAGRSWSVTWAVRAAPTSRSAARRAPAMLRETGPSSSSASGPETCIRGCHRSEESTIGYPQPAQGREACSTSSSISDPPGRVDENPVARRTRSTSMRSPVVSSITRGPLPCSTALMSLSWSLPGGTGQCDHAEQMRLRGGRGSSPVGPRTLPSVASDARHQRPHCRARPPP